MNNTKSVMSVILAILIMVYAASMLCYAASDEEAGLISDADVSADNLTDANASSSGSGVLEDVSSSTGMSKAAIIAAIGVIVLIVVLAVVWKIVKFAFRIGLIIAIIALLLWLIRHFLF